MKDYNFMISDNKLHKTRFCKKKEVGLTKTFLIKRGLGAKGGEELERFCILRRGLAKKREVTFLRGGSYPCAHYVNMGIQFLRDRRVYSMTISLMDGCSYYKNDLNFTRLISIK